MGKPKIRFKGYEDDWEQRKLGEVAQEFKSGNSLKADEIDITGDYPVYGGNGLRGYTSTYNHDGEYALIGRQGALCGNMNYSVGKAYFTEHAVVVKADENNDTRFLYYMLDTMNLGQYSDQSAQPGLAVNKLVKLENQFPMKEEQQRIGWYFSNIDHFITLHQRKCYRFIDIALDAWEQRKLKDYLEVSREKNKTESYGKEDVLSVSGEHGIVNQIEFQGRSFAGVSVANYGVVEAGDVVYTKSPLKSNPYGIIKTNKGKTGIVSTLYAVYKPRMNTNSEFVQIYFELDSRMNSYMHPLVNKGAKNDMKVSDENALKGPVAFPELEEQNAITQYFDKLDRLITLHQRKCEETKSLKKYMLQKMFPENGNCVPKIRFSGFADAWEQRKWIDVVDISTEMVNPTTGEYDNMPHIAPGNIESFTGRILDNVKTVKEEQLISGKFRFRPDDVVYGKINPQLGKYFYATVNGLTSADAYVFNGKNGLKQKFLFALLQTSDFFKYSVSVSKRSGMPKINRDELNAYSFLMPSEEEQDRIGSYLLQLDHLITLHQHKCDELQKLKKFMLQNMFV